MLFVTTVLKRVRWALLVASFVVVATVCRFLGIALSLDSFWRPHNLRKFKPGATTARLHLGIQSADETDDSSITSLGQ